MESPGLMANATAVDIRQVVKEAIESVRASLQWHDVTVELEAEKAPESVRGDEAALRELFVNLVDNAVRYTPDGGKVRVELAAAETGANVTVSDNGPGIPEKELGLIFERFYRGGGAVKTEGTGLGLAIAAQIAEAHGGRIQAESEVGRGSVFKVYLPFGRQS
jgi:signal transduction histidine kinase